MTRRSRLLGGILVSVLAFGLIVRDVDFAHMGTILARAQYAWLIPSIAFTLVAMVVRAHRWRALLDDRVSVWRTFHVWNAGEFLNNVLPMRVGEVARAFLLGRAGDVSVMQTLSTIAVERLLDLLTVCGFLLIVLPFVPTESLILQGIALMAAVAVGGALGLMAAAAWRERWVRVARRLTAWVPARVRDPVLGHADEFLRGLQVIGARRLMISAAWSIVSWIGWIGADWTLLFAFVPEATWYEGVFVTCAIALGLTIPSTPSGAGLFEAAAVKALALFAVPADVALAYGIALHVSNFIVVALAGLWALHTQGQTVASMASSTQEARL